MRTTICPLTVSLLLFCVSPALAAGPAGEVDATQDARARFRRGVQLYNEGSFEAALAEFNKAYQLSPNYRLLYNIAQTQFDLHDYVGAYRNLEQYLRKGGGEITEERRVQVAEMNRKLDDRIGQVEVTCNLDGAEIRIDDIPVGNSPLRAAIPVNAGPRRITAIKVGHPSVVSLVTVTGAEKKNVSLEFVKSKGGDLVEGAGVAAGGMRDAELVSQGSVKKPSRVGLITSSVLAGGCAVATGVFGILTLRARNDFDSELKHVPGSSQGVDDARSKMKSYALATDILGAATLLSAGAAVYFLFADNAPPQASKASGAKGSVALAPTVGGLVLHGAW